MRGLVLVKLMLMLISLLYLRISFPVNQGEKDGSAWRSTLTPASLPMMSFVHPLSPSIVIGWQFSGTIRELFVR